MSYFRKILLGAVLLGTLSVVGVQAASTCPDIVKAALNATSNACSATGRNQASYGNLTLQTQFRDDASTVAFDKIGDIADVTRIKSLSLSSLSEADDSWGVALMKIQANLPEALPGQNVIFIMFGNVEIDDASETSAATPAVDAPVFGPMQAFYFKSGVGDTPCAEVPASGVLIQSPSEQKVSLRVNGADLELGSTAYLQAQPDGFMTIVVVEGSVTVTVNGVTQTVPAGASTRVPLDANGLVSGAPEAPQGYDTDGLAALPLILLPTSISIAPALSVTAEATAAVSDTGLPSSGSWDYQMSALHGCDVTYPAAPTAVQMLVENEGAVIHLGDDVVYDRLSAGVYGLHGLPRDFTALGLPNVREVDNLYVLSPTEMRIDAIDYIPSQDCRLWFTVSLHYIGS